MEIEEGEEWLRKDLSIRCWDDKHFFFSTFVSIPALIVWGLMFPVVALIFIYRNRKLFNDPDTRLKYAYLFLGFLPECYYWEFVI
jgi:hypothetical protein